MPTAGKLVAALLFAAVGYGAAIAFIPELPEGTQVKIFPEINAVIGMLVGWWVMGSQVGNPLLAAARRGLGTSVYLLFWADFVFSMRDMVINSTKFVYPTPTKAVLGFFDNMVAFFLMSLTPAVLTILVVGGLSAGIAAELAHRKWR